MPESYSYFKKEIKEFLINHISKDKRILDVGPGIGTYSKLIRGFGYKMDCIEIYEPYITKYKLHESYDNVHHGDIVNFDISNYDFIILGDVLEHIDASDAENLITTIVESGKQCLVAIPYLMEQGEHEGNIYETHLQPDLTPEVMSNRYPQLDLLFSNNLYGYYISRNKLTKVEKSFVLYTNESYCEITNKCIESIREYSNTPILVYTLDFYKEFNFENVKSIKWECNLDQLNDSMFIKNDNNFYINRSSEEIYKLLIQRPLIVKDALLNHAKTVCYIDSDSIATPHINRIFNFYDENANYPYFVKGIYDFLLVNGRGGAEDESDLSTTLEHPACELFNVNQYVRKGYRQTGYFVAGHKSIDFLDEWYWMCIHPKVLRNHEYYAPFNEETIANVLLWKYNIVNGLPYIYTNGGSDFVDEVYTNIEGVESKLWVKVPEKETDLLFFHGEKRIDEMSQMIEKIKQYKPKKTKILFLAPHLSTGGMPSFLLKRIQSLLEYSKDLDLYVVEYSNHSDQYVVQKNKIKELLPPSHFWTLGEDKMELVNIIEENEFDIIHLDEMIEAFDFHNPMTPKLMNYLYSNNRTWRMVETCHNVIFKPTLEKHFHPEAYAYCTPWHKENTFKEMPSYGEVLEFPIEDKVPSSTEKIDAKLKLGFDFNKKHIVNVGLWTPGKNQKEGVSLAHLIKNSDPEYHFHFVGNQAPNFKDYWEPVMKDLPPNVTIWGERNDVELFLTAADIFMFNSTWECNPLVLREAISYGLPTISRNLPQYMDMFTQYIHSIDDDLSKTRKTLLSITDQLPTKYRPSTDQVKLFAEQHTKLYNRIMSEEFNQQEMMNLEIQIFQHFVNNPFLEIKGNTDKTYKVEFFDEYGINRYTNEIGVNHWVKLNRSYYTKWRTKVSHNNQVIYDETLNLTNKRVYISFDSKSLGDSIAWIPYVLEFKEKHNCTVIVSTFWNNLFEKVYPEIEFVKPGISVNNLNAMYNIGWYYNADKEPEMPNTIPLQKTATNILGLDFKEIQPRISCNVGQSPYNQKYVTIATNSTSGCKFWTREYWQELINHLTTLGYQVINVSKEDNPFDNASKIKDTSIENTMRVIHHSEFLIGLSSGLSWLAWGLGKHVVMISNFTEPDHEFTTNCTRIINKSVCNGCWNNPDFMFDKGDWNWCPSHKGTKRQFECHKSITPEMVITQIQHLLN